MNSRTTIPWLTSLHGGHSSRYCDHAASPLEDIVKAAIARGMPTFGVTEHAPRVEPERLYAEERAMGWTVETLQELFAAYATEVEELQERYRDQISLLRGFEIEIVPEGSYAEVMRRLRTGHNLQYCVGSVHYVRGHIIDYTPESRARAVAACGDEEAFAITYYGTVTEMIEKLKPEVLGHLDLVCKGALDPRAVESDAVRAKAFGALDAAAACGCIIDVNTAGYRKGLGRPYPAPWIVTAALERDMNFAFGDDSHRVEDVAAGIPEARAYLLELGVGAVTVLAPDGDSLTKRIVPLR